MILDEQFELRLSLSFHSLGNWVALILMTVYRAVAAFNMTITETFVLENCVGSYRSYIQASVKGSPVLCCELLISRASRAYN